VAQSIPQEDQEAQETSEATSPSANPKEEEAEENTSVSSEESEEKADEPDTTGELLPAASSQSQTKEGDEDTPDSAPTLLGLRGSVYVLSTLLALLLGFWLLCDC
jgi:hypothetical protein